MSFDNLSTPITRQYFDNLEEGNFLEVNDSNGQGGYDTTDPTEPIFSYNDIANLEASVEHKDQLEISVIFPITDVSHNDRTEMFVVPKTINDTYYTLNTETRHVTIHMSVFSEIPPYVAEDTTEIPIPVSLSFDPEASTKVLIRRKTYSSQPYVTHTPGTRLTSSQLNLQYRQLMNLYQELAERVGVDFLAIDDRYTYNGFVDLETDQTVRGSKTYIDGINLFAPIVLFDDVISSEVSIGSLTNNEGTTTLELQAAVDLTGNTELTGELNVSGEVVFASAFSVAAGTTLSSSLNVGGNAVLLGTLDVAGDTLVAGNLSLGGDFTCSNVLGSSVFVGTVAVHSTTIATSSTSGALIVSGGVGIAKDSWINTIRIGKGNSGIATNLGIGTLVLNAVTSGTHNLGLGHNAAKAITSGTYNVCIGYDAGQAISTTSHRNIFTGFEAGKLSTSNALDNIALGYQAMKTATGSAETHFNLTIGSEALSAITQGSRHMAIGYRALKALTQNTTDIFCVGNNSLATATSASGMAVIGNSNCPSATNINDTVIVGNNVLTSLTSTLVDNSVLIGAGSPGDAVFGVGSILTNSVYVGYASGQDIKTSEYNCFVGRQAGQGDTGSGDVTVRYSTFIGSNAGDSVKTSSNNTCVGYASGSNALTGSYNSALGTETLGFLTSGQHNTAVGAYSSQFLSTGSYNSTLGNSAGPTIKTGSHNIAIGYRSCYSAGGADDYSGSNNIVIGKEANPSILSVSNEITLGNSAITALRCQVGITVLSDSRDKINITNSPYGLNFVNQLRPVTFDWACRDSSRQGLSSCGFIAQELQTVQNSNPQSAQYLSLVYESNPDKLETTPANLIPILVKAIQELSAKVSSLEAELYG